MNRKIFTLLASVLMLFTAVFCANARRVASTSVGDYVKSVPLSTAKEMYHIQVDSICLIAPTGHPNAGDLVWFPVTWNPATVGTDSVFTYDAATDTYKLGTPPATGGDTIVLGVYLDVNNNNKFVKMISATELRTALSLDPEEANLNDLQSIMWCTGLVTAPIPGDPKRPTFVFENKYHHLNLDWDNVGHPTIVGTQGEGWMFAPSASDITPSHPFYNFRKSDLSKDQYRVVLADLATTSGRLLTEYIETSEFNTNLVEGMLKFSLVEVSPIVLNAEDFNTILGIQRDGLVKLTFDDDNLNEANNIFSKYLYAETSINSTAADKDYLNIRTYNSDNKADFYGYITNSNIDNDNKYLSVSNNKYIKLEPKNVPSSDDVAGSYNSSYRFVFFPSKDSLAVNAYHVKHTNNGNTYQSNGYTDDTDYLPNSMLPRSYGLFNENIVNALTIRKQDLSTTDLKLNMVTISTRPANLKMQLGYNCKNKLNGWEVPEGVYTIWDDLGRVLGVRIYNGSYTPQWFYLDPQYGECPDRIPAYQWVVEHSVQGPRVNIYNREFGHIDGGEGIVALMNILVTRDASPIFKYQSQFLYGPLANKLNDLQYTPINDGWVQGRLLDVLDPSDCVVGGVQSGFRPVHNDFLVNPYLGYKHFNVQNVDNQLQSWGKSEDWPDESGMDFRSYNFMYLSPLNPNETYGIGLDTRYYEQVLKVTDNPSGFRFELGKGIKNKQEEWYGYPTVLKAQKDIVDTETNYKFSYPQVPAPILKRYYYRLRVADFHSFRMGHEEQHIVLKGVGQQTTTYHKENIRYYGVADATVKADPLEVANVYFRDSYFLPRDPVPGEFRYSADPSRRIYYAMLDRIESDKLEILSDSMNLILTDTLKNRDGSAPYGLVTLAVQDIINHIKVQARQTSARVSSFSIMPVDMELYRRLRSKDHDIADGDSLQEKVGGPGTTVLDAPKVARIYRHQNNKEYLFEDANSESAFGRGINYLGMANSTLNEELLAPDGTIKYNYHLYIDTAYINRGTGYIKPQYLIAVDVHAYDGGGTITIPGEGVTYDDCVAVPPGSSTRGLKPFTYGRYLVNATDSARGPGYYGSGPSSIINPNYILTPGYDRLVFVDAVHANDRLYILSELKKYIGNNLGDNIYDWIDETTGFRMFDVDKIDELIGKSSNKNLERLPIQGVNSGLAAFYDFGVWNNYHNDVTFSLRFADKDAKNPNEYGDDTRTNMQKRFFIESETTNREVYGNAKIAPVQGGWIKFHNGVPVISRSNGDYATGINEGDVFNIEPYTDKFGGVATNNDDFNSFDVIGGTDEITVLYAEGQVVTVTNVVGQVVASVKISSNNQKIALPKGIVLVSSEGVKNAIKAVVK